MNATDKLVTERKTQQVFREATGMGRTVSKNDSTGGDGTRQYTEFI
jgi:hypothetical protein